MKKSDLKLTSKVLYLGMLIGTIQERVSLTAFQITRFWDLVDKFLILTSPPVKMWQQILGLIASLECFVLRGRVKMQSFYSLLHSICPFFRLFLCK